MKKEEIILKCIKCGTTHQISPPAKILKEAAEIKLRCYHCSYINTYSYAHIIEVL